MTPETTFSDLLYANEPDAAAWITGSASVPNLNGCVKFFSTPFGGTLVAAELFGLPNGSQKNSFNFYAMHIHEFGNCTPPFDKTGNHYNPANMPHPFHAGDLIPILGNQGYGFSVCYTKQFSVKDIIDRSVIIHSKADDFTSQPSGNSGDKIGCGVIRLLKKN